MSVVSYHLTGHWQALIDDTPADPDPHPDIVTVTGHVRFTPTTPGPHLAGGYAYTIGQVTALIANGHLRDLQGRDGLWLTARVGDTPIEWSATITLHYLHHTSTHTTRLTLTGDHHMTGEVA